MPLCFCEMLCLDLQGHRSIIKLASTGLRGHVCSQFGSLTGSWVFQRQVYLYFSNKHNAGRNSLHPCLCVWESVCVYVCVCLWCINDMWRQKEQPPLVVFQSVIRLFVFSLSAAVSRRSLMSLMSHLITDACLSRRPAAIIVMLVAGCVIIQMVRPEHWCHWEYSSTICTTAHMTIMSQTFNCS